MDSRNETAASPDLIDLAFGDGTAKKALMTALVVGSILIAINYGDTMLAGQWPPVWKTVLTYCVPYCVMTWGSITGKRAKRSPTSDATAHTSDQSSS